MNATRKSRLERLAGGNGVISALAMDQRGSLRKAIAAARQDPSREVTIQELQDFKRSVIRVLSKYASAVLLDPEYGRPAMGERAASSGLFLAYELSGYDNTRPGRLPDLIPTVSARRAAELGADSLKLLIYYSHLDPSEINDVKHALVERVGAECEATGLAFCLEILTYDAEGRGEKTAEYARRKPELVSRAVAEFSRPRYGVDILKIEVPVNTAFVPESRAYCGEAVYSRAEALAHFRAIDTVTPLPYLYLSAGVTNDAFLEQIGMATEAQARFSGVLCGRATWKDGIGVFAQKGSDALDEWLEGVGVENIKRINAALAGATPVIQRARAANAG